MEQVYWQHRIWPAENPGPKPSLEAVISSEQISTRADEGLRLTNALSHYWHVNLSGAQLQMEIDRMASASRQPEVLDDLFAALGNDPHLIAEMLARPILAERLARNFYEQDSRFNAKKVSFNTWWEQTRDRFEAVVKEPAFQYSVKAVVQSNAQPAAESWRSLYAQPEGDIAMSAVWTGTEMIVWGGTETGSSVFASGSRYNPATDSWHSTAGAGAPDSRLQHTAVWTGTEMIVWGGCNGHLPEHSCQTNNGSRYNPVTETWTPTTLVGAPSPRINHTAVWTGTEMVVWGGCSFSQDVCRARNVGTTGGRYNPAIDSWTPTNTGGAPKARTLHTAVWTGSQMIVWGGFDDNDPLNTGAVYNLASDSWTPTASLPASLARFNHTAVWTGQEMIIWGGAASLPTGAMRTGARYDPALNTWKPVPNGGAPSARYSHAAVWTGSEMLIWAGFNGSSFPNTGARFNPLTNAWTPTSTVNAPQGRQAPAYVWTGSLFIVWGGQRRTGGRYDPASDTWTPTNPSNAPSAREWHTAVWTGTEMVIWGGDDRLNGTVKSGSRYTPATDSWLPTSIVGAPSPRHLHTATWTGTEMIVYGGAYGSVIATQSARYNPTSNTWKTISNQGAPPARSEHSAVWTGTEMIVFGGSTNNRTWSNDGGRYNPTTDSWTLTSTTNAPVGRYFHSAVWTGNTMVVWGGATSTFDTNTGGRYNPATNTWTSTSLTGAPSARNWTAAVWTGSKMLIWGGQTYSGVYDYHNDGALYDPVSNSWTPTSLVNAPQPRAFFGYVWTGTDLIVWSGCTTNSGACSAEVPTGGRYNVASNSWTPTLVTGAPSARSVFPSVWTGSEMISWGGFDDEASTYTFTGGAYMPGP
jgi:N-acetylneuraminic acid mutarotase